MYHSAKTRVKQEHRPHSYRFLVQNLNVPPGFYFMKGSLYTMFLLGDYTTDKYFMSKITVWLGAGGNYGRYTGDSTFSG